MNPKPEAPVGADVLKKNSRGLRGGIAGELEAAAPGFSKEAAQLLKFHGVYPQQDRDARKRGETVNGCMVRVGIPGGTVTSEQYLALDRLADEAGEGSLRITSRQDIQFHRVQKPDMRRLVRTLNENLLTTLAACGDVVRNVICCPAPSAANSEVLGRARLLARRFKPRTSAYYEIWLDGEKVPVSQPESEPLYGETYLPRKFKIGFAAPGDNCIDVLAQDVGIVPLGKPDTFAIFVGGGLGMSPGVKQTHPRLAEPLGIVEGERLTELIETIITLHRDFGNRVNRKLARLKYVVEEWGIERFRAEVEARLGGPLAPPQPEIGRASCRERVCLQV
jgi:sulfite reductase (ferredoxin)